MLPPRLLLPFTLVFPQVRVQSMYRARVARRVVWAARMDACKRLQAATMLQRVYRGVGTRRHMRSQELARLKVCQSLL